MVLRGYHGYEVADIDAICLTFVKLSHPIVDIPPIANLLINLLFADDKTCWSSRRSSVCGHNPYHSITAWRFASTPRRYSR